MFVAGHDYSGDVNKQSITYDRPYLVFSLPYDKTSKTITIKFSSSISTARTIELKRITSAISSGNSMVTTTDTHKVSKSVSGSGGTYTFDVSQLLVDLEANGNYGLALESSSSDSTNISKSFLISNVTFNWQDEAATTPTVPESIEMGTAANITLNNPNSSVINDIYYEFNGVTDLIQSDVGNGTYSWTPPVDLAEEIQTAKHAACRIYCESYLDGDYLGTGDANTELWVSGSTKCTITSVTLEEYNDEILEQFGAYVQGKSQIEVSVDYDDTNAYGASVESGAININGGQLTENYSVTSPLRTAGTNNYSVTITDSRGKTDTYSGTFNVLAYNAPVALITSAERDANTPTTVNIGYSWGISSVNDLNDKEVDIYVDYGDPDLDELLDSITPSTYSGTGTIQATNIGTTASATFRVDVSDFFTTVSYRYTVPFTGNLDIDVGPDGSIGLGMEAQEDHELDIGLDTNVHGDIGTTGNASIGGTLSTTGTSSFTGAATFNGKVNMKDSALTAGKPLTINSNKQVVSTDFPAQQSNITLLWTNPNSGSSFSAQTVSVSLSAYKFVIIQSRYSSGSSGRRCDICPIGQLGVAFMKSASSNTLVSRQWTTSSSGVAFETGYNGTTANTSYVVPEKIYGVK